MAVDREILVVAALFFAGALVLSLGAFAAHAVGRGIRSRRGARARQAAREALLGAIARTHLDAADLRAVRAVPRGELIELIAELATNLHGADRKVVALAADAAGVRAWALRATRSRRWARRLQGARLLTLLDDGSGALVRLLDDRNAVVRAQAADWAGGHLDPRLAEALVARLDDPSALSRFALVDALIRQGAAAHPPLAAAIPRLPPAAAVLALEAAAHRPSPAVAAAARVRTADDDPAVRAAAVAVLGGAAGEANVAAVVAALDDPAPTVRVAAARALQRLGHWPAGPRLAVALRDPAWDVRAAAARALRTLGPAGELLLERARRDEDPFAADMARHVLEVPR